MANTLLTPVAITREALRVLHNKMPFIASIDKQHDNKMEFGGQKNGGTINIRKPVQYTVRTGRTAAVQDAQEEYTALTVETQKGVDMAFTSKDLTLSIDEFSKRFVSPAMSRLAAQIEADALSMYKSVYNHVGVVGTSPAASQVVLQAGQKLTENLVPDQDQLNCLLTPQGNQSLVNGLGTLFNAQKEVGKQYISGRMGSALGFEFYHSALTPRHQSGTRTNTTPVTNGAVANGVNSIILSGAGNTLTYKAGDVFTIADVYDVNPETKQAYSHLKQFTVLADKTTTSGGAVTLEVSPTPYFEGPKQNISAQIATAKAITNPATAGGTIASVLCDVNMAYHKDAFTFATANLTVPQGVDMAAREVVDGISIRMVRDYDINNDLFITRLDVLYGYVAQRPEWACRIFGG